MLEIKNQKAILKIIVLSILLFLSNFTLMITNVSSIGYQVSFEEIAHIESTGGDTFMNQVLGDLVIVMDMNAGLKIYDISDPVNPILLDSFYDGGIPHQFFIDEDLLYLADHYNGLEIYNISVPNNIQKIGQIADTGDGETDGVFVNNNVAYTAEWHDSTWDWKMVLIDVSDPTNPTNIVDYVDSDNEFVRFYVEDDICYTACLQSGFKILNVSNPMSITEISHFEDLNYCFNFQFNNNLVYLADGRGFNILDVNDITNPTRIGKYNSTLFDVKVKDNLAFAADDVKGIIALNITNVDDIKKIGEFEVEDVVGIDVSDNYLYLSLHGHGFKIVKYEIIESTDEASLPNSLIIILVIGLMACTARIIKKFSFKKH